MKTIYVSPEFMQKTATELPQKPADQFGLTGMGIPLVVTSLLPVEQTWDACNIATRQEIKIPSGEWIHAFMMDTGPVLGSGPIGLMSELLIDKPAPKFFPFMHYKHFYNEGARFMNTTDDHRLDAYARANLERLFNTNHETPPTK